MMTIENLDSAVLHVPHKLQHEFHIIEARGPGFTSADGDMNADSNWTDDEGLTVSLDLATRRFTPGEARNFASELTKLLDRLEGKAP